MKTTEQWVRSRLRSMGRLEPYGHGLDGLLPEIIPLQAHDHLAGRVRVAITAQPYGALEEPKGLVLVLPCEYRVAQDLAHSMRQESHDLATTLNCPLDMFEDLARWVFGDVTGCSVDVLDVWVGPHQIYPDPIP